MKPNLDELMPLVVGIYRKLSKEPGPLDRLQTREFRSIVSQLKKNHEGHFQPEEPLSLYAYLLYDFIVHYQEGLSLIGEVPFTPKRVLDVASGTLPFSLAALKTGAREV